MANTPTFEPPTIPDGTPGWNELLNQALGLVKQFLNTYPTQMRQVYRVSGANPDTARFLNLNAQSAATFPGWHVWVMDAAGDANNPGTPYKLAYSDGTVWRYVANNQTVTIS